MENMCFSASNLYRELLLNSKNLKSYSLYTNYAKIHCSIFGNIFHKFSWFWLCQLNINGNQKSGFWRGKNYPIKNQSSKMESLCFFASNLCRKFVSNSKNEKSFSLYTNYIKTHCNVSGNIFP